MKFSENVINKDNTWQIGTGDDSRQYQDVFFRYGVALVGPGYPGKEGDPSTQAFYKNHPGIKNWGAVLAQVIPGQWLIARKGKGVIVAVGQVLEGYNFSEIFEDVEGWTLQHFVRVKWYRPLTQDKMIWLDSYCLSQSTLQGCNSPEVYQAIYAWDFEEVQVEQNLQDVSFKILTIADLVNALVDEGVRIKDAEDIGLTIQRIIRLAEYYINYDEQALEAEIVSFLILPLFIALGWSEQKIKLQYNYIDIALFKEAFAGNYQTEPEIIIEAKQYYNGLSFTSKQIEGYAKRYPGCKKFIATNGFRYKYYERDNEQLVYKGYFNLMHLKNKDLAKNAPLDAISTILAISNFR